MYKIYADGTLIYDSTVDDFKIGKGDGTLETNKAGSFTFSLYPNHFYYDKFVKKKTVIIVTKSEKIQFRGRVLDDSVDYWNRKEVICEGELNFLQDSIIRPFDFSGTPEELFSKIVNEHNAQVDEFKRFRIGTVTVLDPNNYIARKNTAYESALSNLNSRLLEDSTGGYLHITHGDDGKDPIPTINYLADFTEVSTQAIEFGVNLMDYLRKGDGKEIATAIIPLGAEIDNGDLETEKPRLTIADVNDGVDYVYDEAAVAAHGWIYQTITWDDVTVAENLKAKAEAYLAESVKESITVELTALDLHLLDRSIESFSYDTYVRTVSTPHNFADTLLCHKQTFHLLKPDADTITLGRAYSSFSGTVAKASAAASTVSAVQKDVVKLDRKTSRYRIAEQQLTSLMAQSFGIFKTEEVLEDGSTVYYLHDAPTLDSSQNIWKMTGDAFAVSSNGGETWNAGMDANGNAIMNILSVIGIDASWINTDNLSALAAKIGPWNIDDSGLYCDIPDETDENAYYRVYISTPNSASDALIWCRKVVDRLFVDGVGFTLFADGRMNISNEVWLGSTQPLNESQHAWVCKDFIGFTDGTKDSGKNHRIPGGLYRLADGTVYMTLYRSVDSDVARTFVSPTRMCFISENNVISGGVYIGANDEKVYVVGDYINGTTISGDTVRSRDGVNTYLTIGNVKFTIQGGIITDLVNV